MTDVRHTAGQQGEEFAAQHFERLGFEVLARNHRTRFGELDLVAYDGSTLVFVEVKTRRSDWYAAPEANVDLRKQRQIARAARAYRRALGLSGEPYRYDVVSVIIPEPDGAGTAPPPTVELLRNFWTDVKFKKRRWQEGYFDN